jgi:hypothetical protein
VFAKELEAEMTVDPTAPSSRFGTSNTLTTGHRRMQVNTLGPFRSPRGMSQHFGIS